MFRDGPGRSTKGEALAEQNQSAQTILRRGKIESETGLSRSTIYARIKNKTFPAQIQLGPRAVGWRRGDIDAFLANPAGYRAEVLIGEAAE